MRYRLAIGVIPALLAGCAQSEKPVLTAPIGKSVPTSALTCDAEPSGIAVRTDRDAARFITRLAASGRDCRAKLGAAGAILSGER